MARVFFLCFPWLLGAFFAQPVPASTAACELPTWQVCDLDQKLTRSQQLEIESILEQYRRDHGLVIRLATLPWGSELADLPGLGVEAGLEDEGDPLLLIVSSGGRLSWTADPELSSHLDPSVMYFVESEYLSSLVRPLKSAELTLVEGVRRSLVTFDSLLAGRSPAAYYVWRILESPLDERANPGWQIYAVVALRYLLGIVLMLPLIALFALLARSLLPRLEMPPIQRLLLMLGLIVLLGAAAMTVSASLESPPLASMRPYAVMAALFFLAATPVHLLLFDRLLWPGGFPGWMLALAYLLFPLAIFLLGAAGDWRSATDRLLRGLPPNPNRAKNRGQ